MKTLAFPIAALAIFLFGFIYGRFRGRPMQAGTIAGLGVLTAYLLYLAVHEKPGKWAELFAIVGPFLALPAIVAFAVGYIGCSLGERTGAPAQASQYERGVRQCFTCRAGSVIQFLGWTYLAYVTFLLFAAFAVKQGTAGAALGWIAMAVFVSIMTALAAACFAIGNRLKRGKAKARTAGILLALFSLISLPIGTVLGLMALVNFIKGRNEYDTAG